MKVPVNEAINSGAWFKCISVDDEHNEYAFRLKIISFEKIKLKEVDAPNKINFDLKEGDIWLMKIQCVNLNKNVMSSYDIASNIILFDQDDFEFPTVDDDHLQLDSEYSEISGLKNLFGESFIPKIKYWGSVIFYLPKEDEAKYFFSIRGGNINEA